MSNKRGGKAKPKAFKLNRKIIFTGAGLILISIAVVCTAVFFILPQNRFEKFINAENALADYIFSGDIEASVTAELKESSPPDANLHVFFSVSDGKNRADVVNGSGNTLARAYNDAKAKAGRLVRKKSINIKYLKVDFVSNIIPLTRAEFSERLNEETYETFFRYGIALDQHFNTALLEGEIHGKLMLNKENSGGIVLKKLNAYLKERGSKEVKSIPDNLYIFSCKGFFYDEGKCYTLNDKPGPSYGRRISDNSMSLDYLTLISEANAQFLAGSANKDGSFVYGRWAATDNPINNYNIMRHTGAVWGLVNHYAMTGDDTLRAPIEGGINYLINAIEYQNENTAYIVERKSNEIKLGANGIAICMLIDYMNTFKTDEYAELCSQLGEGILKLLNEQGEFYHILYYDQDGEENFSRKEPFRTVYYDGEATFGLCTLYEFSGEQKWLDAAQAAVEHFIAADYVSYRDHWVAYSINEITKHIPDERYFIFGLRNAAENLDWLYSRRTPNATGNELLMSAYLLFERLKQSGVISQYINDQFPADKFIDTLFYRMDFILNTCMLPEYAIYMANPERIKNVFFTRQDNHRMRIDDVQHMLGGYHLFIQNYDSLIACRAP